MTCVRLCGCVLCIRGVLRVGVDRVWKRVLVAFVLNEMLMHVYSVLVTSMPPFMVVTPTVTTRASLVLHYRRQPLKRPGRTPVLTHRTCRAIPTHRGATNVGASPHPGRRSSRQRR